MVLYPYVFQICCLFLVLVYTARVTYNSVRSLSYRLSNIVPYQYLSRTSGDVELKNSDRISEITRTFSFFISSSPTSTHLFIVLWLNIIREPFAASFCYICNPITIGHLCVITRPGRLNIHIICFIIDRYLLYTVTSTCFHSVDGINNTWVS